MRDLTRNHLQLISIFGALSGLTNCLSRLRMCSTLVLIITVIFHVLVGGILVDYFQFRVVMPVLSLLLAIIFASIFFIGQQSFIGWMMMFWLINLLSFAHFSCIPATVHISSVRYYSIFNSLSDPQSVSRQVWLGHSGSHRTV